MKRHARPPNELYLIWLKLNKEIKEIKDIKDIKEKKQKKKIFNIIKLLKLLKLIKFIIKKQQYEETYFIALCRFCGCVGNGR